MTHQNIFLIASLFFIIAALDTPISLRAKGPYQPLILAVPAILFSLIMKLWIILLSYFMDLVVRNKFVSQLNSMVLSLRKQLNTQLKIHSMMVLLRERRMMRVQMLTWKWNMMCDWKVNVLILRMIVYV